MGFKIGGFDVSKGVANSIAGGLALGGIGSIAGGLTGMDIGIGSINDVINHATDVITGKGEHDRAHKEAQAQTDRANALTDEQIAFQRQQYDDWKSIYGPLQEDLGTYFKNLNGSKLAAQAITKVQAESQKAQQNIDKDLAQRGLSGSGMEAAALMNNEFTTANQKANIRANADSVAAKQKMGFLGLGLGQGTQMLGINANVGNTGINSSTGLAANYSTQATNIGLSGRNNMFEVGGSTIGAIGSALGNL